MAFEQISNVVDRLVPELLIGSRLELMRLGPGRGLGRDQALAICVDSDRYEFRVGIPNVWMRVVRRIYIDAECWDDEPTLRRALNERVSQMRVELAGDLRALAEQVDP